MNRTTLHVVMLSSLDSDAGGRETWVRYFAEGLRSDFERIVVHGARHTRDLPTAWPPGAEIRRPAFRGALGFFVTTLARLIGGLRRGDVVVYCGVPIEMLIALPVAVLRPSVRQFGWARSRGADEIAGAWGQNQGAKRRVALALLRIGERAAVQRVPLIFNGADTRDHFVAAHGPRLRGGYVIPNAVQIPSTRSDRPRIRDTHASHEPFRVAYVGRLVETKGFADFQALAEAFAQDEGLRFEVWGLNTAAYAISPTIEYHGPVPKDEVEGVLRDIDAIVFLNRNLGGEASGVSHGILEAMAVGTPVLAWDNETHRQLLDTESAWLVAEGDVQGLIRALEEMVHGPLEPRTARGIVRADGFSVQAHVSAFRSILNEVP